MNAKKCKFIRSFVQRNWKERSYEERKQEIKLRYGLKGDGTVGLIPTMTFSPLKLGYECGRYAYQQTKKEWEQRR